LNRLRAFRNMLGISRADLARAVGRSAQILEKYEAELPPELAAALAAHARAVGRGDAAEFLGASDLQQVLSMPQNSEQSVAQKRLKVNSDSNKLDVALVRLAEIQRISAEALEELKVYFEGVSRASHHPVPKSKAIYDSTIREHRKLKKEKDNGPGKDAGKAPHGRGGGHEGAA
jgi:transcriptional regulator with XRE-family HTH domain